MKKRLFHSFTLLLAFFLTACSNNDNESLETSQQSQEDTSQQNQEYAEIGSGAHLVKFPDDLKEGIVFATYDRGDIHENIYVNSREAIEAVQNGEELPNGTVITLEGFRDGELEHYLVMEKRTGWGSQYSPEERTGEWEFQAFTPDEEVMEDGIGGPAIGRCYTCHANQERDQFMNSMEQMKEFDLGEISQSKNESIETAIEDIPADHWNVSEISAGLIDSKNKKESNLIEGQEKVDIIQDILLKMYLQQFKS
ncbi:cytochrome P460 family protein [Neobacillus sp. 179-C4.2 HS]|uniref:Cytochrome P460 family protein n=1 Tax=Neobacillus driksii TaxID=3035913 RepID=A0ABV4YPI4_9BACI|nr:cytochrome P460 family protein [Neobacillus sp. 179.-C4.2 HS]MDP5197078.1 cytochrome P460 family protein [Neobacillus sp. 179.-C4.2 HS]